MHRPTSLTRAPVGANIANRRIGVSPFASTMSSSVVALPVSSSSSSVLPTRGLMSRFSPEIMAVMSKTDNELDAEEEAAVKALEQKIANAAQPSVVVSENYDNNDATPMVIATTPRDIAPPGGPAVIPISTALSAAHPTTMAPPPIATNEFMANLLRFSQSIPPVAGTAANIIAATRRHRPPAAAPHTASTPSLPTMESKNITKYITSPDSDLLFPCGISLGNSSAYRCCDDKSPERPERQDTIVGFAGSLLNYMCRVGRNDVPNGERNPVAIRTQFAGMMYKLRNWRLDTETESRLPRKRQTGIAFPNWWLNEGRMFAQLLQPAMELAGFTSVIQMPECIMSIMGSPDLGTSLMQFDDVVAPTRAATKLARHILVIHIGGLTCHCCIVNLQPSVINIESREVKVFGHDAFPQQGTGMSDEVDNRIRMMLLPSRPTEFLSPDYEAAGHEIECREIRKAREALSRGISDDKKSVPATTISVKHACRPDLPDTAFRTPAVNTVQGTTPFGERVKFRTLAATLTAEVVQKAVRQAFEYNWEGIIQKAVSMSTFYPSRPGARSYTNSDITGILCVGGGFADANVRDVLQPALAGMFPNATWYKTDRPDKCVALGASIAARWRLEKNQRIMGARLDALTAATSGVR